MNLNFQLIQLCFLCLFVYPAQASRPIVVAAEQIRVGPGKPYITFRGEDPLKTILTYRLSAQQAGNTRLAFSTYVNANDFRAENLTFENSYGTGSQAVALFVDAERAVFQNCRFLGWQDTLFVNGGFVFLRCRLTGQDTERGVYLGRPWRPYARVVFLESWLRSHIRPEGWDNWKDPARETTAWFGEYMSSGPGANPKARVPWSKQLSGVEAKLFHRERFFSLATERASRKPELQVGAIAWKDAQAKAEEWYASVEALRMADNVLLYQRDSGGWPKNIELAKALSDREQAAILREKKNNDSTIDNGATYTQLSFLARVYTAQHHDRHRESFSKGLDYLLKAQYPNGGWPQFYPNLNGYYKRITYNDGAMIGVMNLLRDVATAKPEYAFVDEAGRAKASSAVEKGIECILKTQVVVDGRRTVWCAQHDEVTFAPAPARKFELASLSGGESVDIVRFLMSIKDPSPAVVESIESAVKWFEQSELKGVKWVKKADATQPNGFDCVVVKDPESSAWARFYEIGTNRPIFAGRDGVLKYDVAQIEHERRTGYEWYVDAAAKLLKKDYPAWKKRHVVTTRVH